MAAIERWRVNNHRPPATQSGGNKAVIVRPHGQHAENQYVFVATTRTQCMLAAARPQEPLNLPELWTRTDGHYPGTCSTITAASTMNRYPHASLPISSIDTSSRYFRHRARAGARRQLARVVGRTRQATTRLRVARERTKTDRNAIRSYISRGLSLPSACCRKKHGPAKLASTFGKACFRLSRGVSLGR